jgi:osmotically inducible protein OsmC
MVTKARIERTAQTVWEGSGPQGRGVVNGGSGALKNIEITAPARFEAPDGKTSPEELVAAAHSSCYGMQLAFLLSNAGTPPERLDVHAAIGMNPKEGGGFQIVYSQLSVTGTVPGMSEADFLRTAEEAKNICPISNLIKGNVEITLDAKLAQ